MKSPQAIVFDLDGTLIHSVPDMHVSLNRTLQAMGRATLDIATAQSFVGNGVEKLIWRALDATGGTEPDEHAAATSAFLADYETQKTVLTRPYPGVVACLDSLRVKGIPMAICTNKPQAPARSMCEALNLDGYFAVISGATPDVPRKPDPTPLLRCIKALRVAKADTVFVGDSLVDYHTACAAEVPFRFFTGGYLNGPLPELKPEEMFDSWDGVTFTL